MAAVSRKKLVSPEAQRIISVLDECVCKIDVLLLLPCELLHPESISQELGDTAVESLREHLRLSEEFRSLQDTETRKDQAIAMQDSLRNFLRHVRPHQWAETVKAVLQGAGPITEDQRAVQELGAGLRELRHVLMERMLTTPREERERKRYGQEVRKRQERNVEVLHRLEQEVRETTTYRDQMISKKDEEIRRLKDSLHQMERVWEEFVLQVQKKAEQQNQSDMKNSEMKQLRLQEEANQLQAQLDLLTTQNREREAILSKKNNKMETEIENWIQKYDMEMEEKQVKLEHLTQVYMEEQAELRELQEHLAVLEIEYSQIMEERQKKRERREKEEREREMKSRAAVIIQAFWRGWKVRKAMKSKAKSKKSKKAKGKKGK
ncbi:hypothetical protein KOW79_021659 [Hemibagrus wyckioides]|uniref:Dynein regulatory complex protein 10 n=1 Tax=Hemibagrus wyckioides TaxID=337641 RepID=A0A9D3N1M8_9TELE|nr:dynein regulatory complex protein 10 [Hemibagrus wyckioides]XP_058239448.1 dynein regulatory complex protein 10 [Hemibagrus wyckioides]XP_058239449.1 dynein regulatory complex protein 10 [Hemibagrus wyckioides]KAG7314356.1 hypothetical protein KOW79_021659 [Hemibagrus wyckioides]